MNLKRASWVAVLMYITSFIVGLIPMIVMGVDTTQLSEFPTSFFIVGILISVILAVFYTLFYLRDESIKRTPKEGLLFGLIVIVAGFILDGIMFGIMILTGQSQFDLAAYYTNIFFWLAAVLVIVTTTLVTYLKGRK